MKTKIKNTGWFQQMRENARRKSTRDLMQIDSISYAGLKTKSGLQIFFGISPTNLSVLSEDGLSARINALMTVLKGQAEIDLLCLNSRENFEDNKRYKRKRLSEEKTPQVRRLLEKDLAHLDRIQVQTVTAREFLIIIRLRSELDAENLTRIGQIEKIIGEQSFSVRRLGEDDLKKLLGVYFEQNVTTDRFEDFDGERWIIFGD